MKVRIIKIGKPVSNYYCGLVEIFHERLKSQMDISSVVLKAHKELEKTEKELNKQLDKFQGPAHLCVALDERGRNFSSPGFAKLFQSYYDNPQVKSLSFIIGGPYGLSSEFKSRCHMMLRISDMVFPSDLAWLMVWEQIYRAQAILQGSPYHHV